MDFEDRKSSKDLINNATMSDDKVVASYGPDPRGPRSLWLGYTYIDSFVVVKVNQSLDS